MPKLTFARAGYGYEWSETTGKTAAQNLVAVAKALQAHSMPVPSPRENVRCAAAAGGPRRRPSITLLPTERPPGRREGASRGRSGSEAPWPILGPRLVCWGERREYSQWGMARSIRSSCQSRCGKPYPRYPRRSMSAPVIACPAQPRGRLHRPRRATRCGPPASSCASAACATASRCRISTRIDGVLSLGGEQSVRDIDADPMLTAEAALPARGGRARDPRARRLPGRPAARPRARRPRRPPAAAAHRVDADRAAAGRGRRPGGRHAARGRHGAALERGRLRAAARRRRAAAPPPRPHRRGVPRTATARGACSSTPRSTPRASTAGTRSGYGELDRGRRHRGAGARRRRAATSPASARCPTRCSAASPAWWRPAPSPRDRVPAPARDPDALERQRRLRARQQRRVLRVLRHRDQRVPDPRGRARHPRRRGDRAVRRVALRVPGPARVPGDGARPACGSATSAARACATRSASTARTATRPPPAGSCTCSWTARRGGRRTSRRACGPRWRRSARLHLLLEPLQRASRSACAGRRA